MIRQTLIILILFFSVVQSQTIKVSGTISDKTTKHGLPYSNLRVINSNLGTSANLNGMFELRLNKGVYKLVASYIGFKSDTISVNLSQSLHLDIALTPITVELETVTVEPGLNPAIPIMEKAIAKKTERNKKLNSYSFTAYTKGLVKTTKDISVNSNSVGLTLGEKDSSKLKITGILENESRGYFQKPNNYKEEIVAQKQSSNFTSQLNVLTGGRIIQDFYKDDIEFFSRPLPSPISEDAFDYYFFYLENTLKQDTQTVYQIYFATVEKHYPGFWGRVYISDYTYDLLKIDVNINDAANPGGFFTKVNIFQQFLPYDDVYMPVDYRLFVEGNAMGLLKFGFEINSILYDFEINKNFEDDFFDMTILKVLPGADKKDSLFWKNTQTIPNTLVEAKAYSRIDSIESLPVSFWDNFNLLSDRINLSKDISIAGLLGMYRFNKTEGHTVGSSFNYFDREEKRFGTGFNIDYGFSDEKLKSRINAFYRFGELRTHLIEANYFDDINTLFSETDKYNSYSSTVLSLFSKYDFRDYYYSKGFNTKWSGSLFPVINFNVGFASIKDQSAFNNTDYSFFYKERKFRENIPVYEGKQNSFSIGLQLDFRKFIEDGYFRRRSSQGKSFILTDIGMELSDGSFGSDLNYKLYKLNIYGLLNTFKSASMRYNLHIEHSNEKIPIQKMYALPGNINTLSKNFTFKTLSIGEVFGNQVYTLNMVHQFNDELFILSGLPIIKDLQLMFSIHSAIAYSHITDENKASLPVVPMEFKSPFIEAGFSIGQAMIPLAVDFSWKLTHRGRNNFVISLNTFVL